MQLGCRRAGGLLHTHDSAASAQMGSIEVCEVGKPEGKVQMAPTPQTVLTCP